VSGSFSGTEQESGLAEVHASGEILIGAAPWTEAAIADESVGLRELVEPDR
jgi:hypothetical protein